MCHLFVTNCQSFLTGLDAAHTARLAHARLAFQGRSILTIPLDLRGRDLGAAKNNVVCLESCEAVCMTACELRQLEGRGARQEEQAASYTGPYPQQTSLLDESSGRGSVVEAR